MLYNKAIGATASAQKTYIEDVFNTYLYTGNGSTQTITNGIDLSGKGGLVWIKSRSVSQDHALYDTARGASNRLYTNSTIQQITDSGVDQFSSNGFSIGSSSSANANADNYTSWTFRKAAKFFDVVTYTGNGTAGRTISHNLGSTPGCIIVKRTDTTGNWNTYHRSLGATQSIVLNTTGAAYTSSGGWNDTTPTSSVFTVGSDSSVNANGSTYVAYLFAHDAGGFGDSGNDNVISCGSVTTNGSGQIPTVNLGWEPQWLIMKNTTSAGNWDMYDTMRGWVSQDQNQFNRLSANVSSAEATGVNGLAVITSTGFRSNTLDFGASQTYIYIAIRRGPMKTPTDATKVFANYSWTGTGGDITVNNGFPADAVIHSTRQGGYSKRFGSRFQNTVTLNTTSTAAEANNESWQWDTPTGTFFFIGNAGGYNSTSETYIKHFFRRAPGFFDVVAYTGTGVARTVSHNLGVVPELMIVKRRTPSGSSWYVYDSLNGSGFYLNLNGTAGRNSAGVSAIWNNTAPTASVFTVGIDADVNGSTNAYIAYLFASCPGVSKVGSYTGTGTTHQINCGFTNGARFVLIKRTDSTGDWYVWDTARGIVSANDPYLLLNSTAAEVTNTDYIDPLSSGFEISSTAPAAINANGGSFIFLAVA